MSCLSPPPVDRSKAPNPLEVLVLILFVVLLIIGALTPAGAARSDPAPSDVLGYWGLCSDDGPCFTATLRFREGRSLWDDCLVSMLSVETVLSSILGRDFRVRAECVHGDRPEPQWWRAMRKDEAPV